MTLKITISKMHLKYDRNGLNAIFYFIFNEISATMRISHQTVTGIVTISNITVSVIEPRGVTPTKRMKKWKRNPMSEVALINTNNRPHPQRLTMSMILD